MRSFVARFAKKSCFERTEARRWVRTNSKTENVSFAGKPSQVKDCFLCQAAMELALWELVIAGMRIS